MWERAIDQRGLYGGIVSLSSRSLSYFGTYRHLAESHSQLAKLAAACEALQAPWHGSTAGRLPKNSPGTEGVRIAGLDSNHCST